MTILERLNAALQGRYRLERELGEGGMARVYLARDLKHDRPVAVKVLRPELSAEVDSERFLSEIRTTANLQHPHILPLFDSGDADGLLFYVMPYVRGESLREKLVRDGALPVAEAVRIGAALADALEHAHRQGVLHRDIKPGNVMLSDGEPLLADFGIALALRRPGTDRLTRTGSSVGTPGYMSPEQAAGERELDTPSDIYSLGALCYEMLTGAPPFAHLSPRAALAKVLTDEPPRPAELDGSIPGAVSRQVSKALSREPSHRHGSAGDFARDLRAASATISAGASRKARVSLLALGAVTVGAVAVAALALRGDEEARWARTEALPEIQRLVEAGEAAEAFRLATRARVALPEDPSLADLYEATSVPVTFTSDPPGAEVAYRPYDPEDTAWTVVATTPSSEVDLPAEELLLRFALPGHHTRFMSFTPTQARPGHADLEPSDVRSMIPVESTTYTRTGESVPIGRFRMDELEVTNGEYREFVEAAMDWDPRFWVEPFTDRGMEVDLERMRAELVDATGRPGPAGWELSRPPEGRGRHPVQGVSWFEAVAYCAYRGAELPTYYHWKTADAGDVSPWDGILAHANLLDGAGSVPVGSTQTYSVRGVADLAGNVREWVWNAAGDDRYVLGGSWESPPHMYTDYDATDPWSRSPENGFRCAAWEEEPDPRLFEPIERPIFDFTGYQPVDAETYALYASFFEYDRGPLEATRMRVAESDAWIRYRVEVDAAYLDDRLPIHMFLPKDVEPPYQSVIYMPGSAAFAQTSSENLSEMSELMFIPQSGRALLYPVLWGTYERRSERPSRGMAEARQRYVWLVQDVMRTMDFAEEEETLADDGNAYLGLSFGAELAVPVAMEKRFEAAVLIGAALDPAWRGSTPEEVAPWNHVSRITTPSMVINGRYDFMHPYEESQLPFFEMIDVPEGDKELVVIEAGHLPPNNEVIRHTLRWLDERLGPVAR